MQIKLNNLRKLFRQVLGKYYMAILSHAPVRGNAREGLVNSRESRPCGEVLATTGDLQKVQQNLCSLLSLTGELDTF